MTVENEEDNWYCIGCEDDFTVWLRFETWIWAVMLLTQMSMIVFIVIHGRKDKTFRQAFYVFFIAVTLVDCALVLLRPSRESGETIFGTVYDEPYVYEEDMLTREAQEYLTIRGTVNAIIKHAVVPALGHAQPLFLTVIAVNRFTAFAFPLKHQSMWRTRTVVVVAALLTTISVVLGAALPVIAAIQQATKCPSVSLPKNDASEGLDCPWHTWAFNQERMPIGLMTITSTICCVASFALNIGSIAMLIVLRRTGRLQRKGPEVQLFAHSLWMFLLQILLTFQDIVYIADSPEAIARDLRIWDVQLGFIWAYFRHSTEWLAGMNATRRWEEDWVYFTPGCIVEKGSYYNDDALPTCQAWYLLLTGELRLREDPIFTVRTLELCLFALSGSIFLLMISGNVRDAYFKFYFKWSCLKKNRVHHSSVKVITMTVRRAPTPLVAMTPVIPTS